MPNLDTTRILWRERGDGAERHSTMRIRDRKARRTLACEVCQWPGPEYSREFACRLLHLHHVVPVCVGGSTMDVNLVLLCPNHHALAHAATFLRSLKGCWYYIGPRSREALLDRLRRMEAPDRQTNGSWGEVERERALMERTLTEVNGRYRRPRRCLV